VRDAFEEERGIEGIKGITPALAHTFLLESTQRALAREPNAEAADLNPAQCQCNSDREHHRV